MKNLMKKGSLYLAALMLCFSCDMQDENLPEPVIEEGNVTIQQEKSFIIGGLLVLAYLTGGLDYFSSSGKWMKVVEYYDNGVLVLDGSGKPVYNEFCQGKGQCEAAISVPTGNGVLDGSAALDFVPEYQLSVRLGRDENNGVYIVVTKGDSREDMEAFDKFFTPYSGEAGSGVSFSKTFVVDDPRILHELRLEEPIVIEAGDYPVLYTEEEEGQETKVIRIR